MSWIPYLTEQIEHLRHGRLSRRRGGASGVLDPNGHSRLDFGTNDYLGIRNHPLVLQAIREAAEKAGWGSGASPVLSGYRPCHRDLECKLAELSATEDALVFSSGYSANVGVLSCLLDEKTIVFSDSLNHASLIDGIRLGRASRIVYPHGDMDGLQQSLKQRRADFDRALIVTESVFSMDGDVAPLEPLADLADRFDCGLVVDEAHAVGVFGHGGGGLLEELGLSNRVLVKLGTLSKALGGIGGYAAGSKTIIEFLVNRSRSYIFSTAPPALSMIASLRAVELLQGMSAERTHLAQLAERTRQQLLDQGWNVLPGRSPIVPVVVGGEAETLSLSQRLLEQGIYVPAIRPPTVPSGSSRLRISLTARHTLDDVQRLCNVLGMDRIQ